MSRIGTVLGVIGLGLCVSSTAMSAPHYLHDGGRIAAALDAGQIDDQDALWLSYLMHFEPEALPLDYVESEVDSWRCSTGLVLALQEEMESFSEEQQERIRSRVFPLDEAAALESLPPAPPNMPKTTCVSQQGDNKLDGNYFSVQWDSGTVSESKAEDFLEVLEYSYEKEVDDLGWQRPTKMSQYLMLAFIQGGGGSGAYTTVFTSGSCSSMPYIVASSSGFSSGNWYRSMAAHEFNHASQFSYDYAFEFYWWEATATYIEDDVYPSDNWWSAYIGGYSDNPWLAMNVSSQSNYTEFNHMYGMAILGFYIEKYVGGHDLIIDMWEWAETRSGYYTYGPDDALDALGYDWETLYDDFVTRNTVMEYDDQMYFGSVDVEDTVRAVPATGASSSSTEPEYYGQNYIEFDLDPDGDDTTLEVTFEGQSGGNWSVQLVGTSLYSVEEVVPFTINSAQGTAQIDDIDMYNRVWMVVSPRTGTSGFSYSWSADLLESAGGDTGNGGGGGGGGGGKGGAATSCGCSAIAMQPLSFAAFGLPLLGLLVSRRKRA